MCLLLQKKELNNEEVIFFTPDNDSDIFIVKAKHVKNNTDSVFRK